MIAHRPIVMLLISIFWLCVGLTFADDPADNSAAVLARFVGNWRTEIVDKAEPDVKKIEYEDCQLALDKKFLLCRQTSETDAAKVLYLMTYDPKKMGYRYWFFLGEAASQLEFSGQWDEKQEQMTVELGDPKLKVVSRFLNRDTLESKVRGEDENGEVTTDMTGKQVRQSAEKAKQMLAKWEAVETPAELESETAANTLNRLAGSWDVKWTHRPSEWVPKEQSGRYQTTGRWVLDKRYLLTTWRQADREHLSLFTYEDNDYKAWWFDSSRKTAATTGLYPSSMQFQPGKEHFPGDLDAGLMPVASLGFPDDDHYLWTVTVKDESGKKFFDGEWAGTRVK